MLSPIHNIPDVKVLDRVLRLALQEILTDLVHADYFEVCWVIKLESINRLHSLLLFFFFLEHAGELRINILRRRKRGGGPPKCYSLSGPVTALLTYN